MFLTIGALLGLLSVAFGAYAEHGLRAQITDAQFHTLMTALRYHQINAMMISSIGLAHLASPYLRTSNFLRGSGLLFIVGTVLFSFSIYASVVLKLPILIKAAPIGGTLTMLAWLLLAYAGWSLTKHNTRLK
jgi:uncharacterized membrane protein YgdD (TMEM256/DUF423 family)